jgi:hypothetical protein
MLGATRFVAQSPTFKAEFVPRRIAWYTKKTKQPEQDARAAFV